MSAPILPSVLTATLWHGRLLIDLRPKVTWLGPIFEWTIEDLDLDLDGPVATGLAATPDLARLETTTAALAYVRRTRAEEAA